MTQKVKSSYDVRPAFVVGVTGLMDIHADDSSRVHNELQMIFDWITAGPEELQGPLILGRPLGLGTTTPIMVLSSLAPGADQTVARLGLGRGFQLRAPLPFPPDLYRDASTFKHSTQSAHDELIQVARQSGLTAPTQPAHKEGFAELASMAEKDGLARLCELAKQAHADLKRQEAFDQILKEVGPENAFHVLLAEDVGKSEVCLLEILKEDLKDRHRRNRRYRAAGEYVAAYSDLLIAICDQVNENDPPQEQEGLDPDEQSGSSTILQVRRQGMTQGILPLRPSVSWMDNGPVVRVYARRNPKQDPAPLAEAKKTAPAEVPLAVWHPVDSRPHAFSVDEWNERQMESFRAFATRLNELNVEIRKKPEWLDVNVDEVLGKMLPEKTEPFEPQGTLEVAWEWIEERFGRTEPRPNQLVQAQVSNPKIEKLAVFRAAVTRLNRDHYDMKVKKLGVYFFWTTLVAAIMLQYAENWVPSGIGSGAPPGWLRHSQFWAFFGAIAIFGYSWLRNFHKRRARLDDWQNDTRAVGEALRVQFYWTASGTGESVASNYLQRSQTELSWIRAAVSVLAAPYEEDRRAFADLSPSQKHDRLKRVYNGWILEQLKFFEARVFSFNRLRIRLRFIGNLCLFGGMGLTIMNILSTPERFEAAMEKGMQWIEWRCLAYWVVATAFAWLALQVVHLKALRTCPEKAAANPASSTYRPGPTSGTKRPWKTCYRYLQDQIETNWILALAWGLLFSIGLAGAIESTSKLAPSSILPEPDRLRSITKNVLLGFGGLLHWWAAMKFLVENVRRYSAAAGLFRGAADRTKALLDSLSTNAAARISAQQQKKTIENIQSIYVSLGKEALNENADWLVMHRNKPCDPLAPAG